MSLGGYTTALLATVEERLDFAVPIIPLASMADVADKLGRLLGDAEEQRAQREALDRVHRVVSPLARPAQLDPERVLIVGAEADRITPLHHARRLAGHFGAPLEVVAGGHILQLGRGQGFRAVGRLLGRLGLLE
jgi:pimeloyl-ACP methyl ester carboxylesterase